MVERAGYREIFVPLNAGNGSNTGVAIEIAGLRGDLRVIAYGNFVMVDATVEVSEQGGGFATDDGGFEVGAGEVADGFEGTPQGFNEDFDFAFEAAKGNGGFQVARDAAELGQNIRGKMFEIFGQLCFGGTGRPATQDGS